jgi:TonB family protein
MVTNEPIVSQVPIPERVERETSDIPVFSSFESARVGSGGAAKFFKVAVFVVVVAAGGYFGWTRLRPLKYLQQMRASRTASDVTLPTSTPAPAPTAPTVRATTPTEVTQQPPVQNQHDLEISAAPVHSDSENDDADDIRVQELPMSRDSKPAPKAEPLVVKSDSAARKLKAAQPVPPPVQVSTANGAALPLSNLPESAPQLPKLAPNSLRVSQGVSQGLILKKVPPQYPQMALQLHKQGAVELQVTITKQGTISNVKVISGDALLARAAADAVHQWKYRPYLLDGEPVEIQTQITINFTAPH